MVLKTVDLNYWYEMQISTGEHGNAICFELNNLSKDTPKKEKVPNETSFIMSIEDARQLYAWLGSVLVKPQP